ncbi:hypothetical protein V8C86DRAFT_2846175 [Haematococcus lacustris]
MVWTTAAKTTAAKCSLLALLLVSCCPTNAQSENDDGGALAESFCNSTGKTLSCGWASESEQKSSIKGCTFCGTVWGGEPTSLPTILEHSSSAYKLYPRIISLGCSGEVMVRTDFTVLSTDGCSRLLSDQLGSQASGTSSITRCELSKPGSFDTGNCQNCTTCADCPFELGQTYSDTFSTNVEGCKGVLWSGTYEPAIVSILMNPYAKIQLNRFDVGRLL